MKRGNTPLFKDLGSSTPSPTKMNVSPFKIEEEEMVEEQKEQVGGKVIEGTGEHSMLGFATDHGYYGPKAFDKSGNPKWSSTEEVQWIREKYGPTHRLSKDDLIAAKKDFYQTNPPAGYEFVEGQGVIKSSDIEKEGEEVVRDMEGNIIEAKKEETVGPRKSEFTKSIEKGYFDHGEGASELYQNRPRPGDYDSAEEFSAAIKVWEKEMEEAGLAEGNI